MMSITMTPQFARRLRFWPLQALVWIGYGIEHFFAGLGSGQPLNWYRLSVLDAALGLVLTSALRWGLKASWRRPLRERIAIGLVLLAAISFLWAYVFMQAVDGLCLRCQVPQTALGYLSWFAGTLFILLAWTGAYVAIKLAFQLQVERETALHAQAAVQQAQAAAQQAQLRALRYQLNPHFLFNALNTFSTMMIEHRGEEGERMIAALSGFLRHSLDGDPAQPVPLARELEATRRYLSIEQARLGARLRVDYTIAPEALEVPVPALILQPLVENAILHAIAPREEGGCIAIEARTDGDALEIAVRDDGPGSDDYAAVHGNGVGLANVRERLRVLYAGGHRFEIGRASPGTLVRLRIPRSIPENPGRA
jgi:two-component system LytT family sensor kinase